MGRNSSQKINLMIATDPNGQGGIASVVRTMLAQPFAQDWDIQLVVSHQSISKLGLVLVLIRAFFIIFLMRLKGSPGIAHLHLASRGSFSRKALLARWAHFLGFRILVHLHGGQFDQFYQKECSPAKKQKVAQLFYLAEHVVVLSNKWFCWVKDTFPAVKNLHIVYNSGPSDVLPRQHTATPTLLFLGRIGEAKGIHDLIEALPDVIAQVPGLKVILGGDGDIARFQQQAETAGILSQIEFAGWIEKERKFQLLASSSVFVLPSYYEGFPVGIIEAMACSIPIVATNVGGIPDAITDQQDGLLVHAGDVVNLRDALIKLLTDQQYAEKLASNALRKYEQTFCCGVIMPQWNQIYKDISSDNCAI